MKKGKVGVITKVISFIDDHQREILLGFTIVGVVSTGITAWRNAPKAKEIIERHKQVMYDIPLENKEARKKESLSVAKELAPLVLPPVVLGGLTIASAVGGHTASTKQIAALTAAYSISEKTLSEYKDKAKELFGEKKEQGIVDAISQDTVTKNPPINETVISTGKGQTLCYDDYSGRYFYSDAESIRRAVNVINKRLMDEYYISLNDFYEEIGLPDIRMGNDLGFCIDDAMLEPTFSTTLTPDDRPCLVISYCVSPKYGYGDLGGPKFYR